MKKIAIIGAGFSGLSLAHELVKLGFSVDVYEKKDHVGGLISSPMTDLGMYETAANGFLNTAAVEIFLEEIGIKPLGSSLESKNRYIFRGKPTRWPLNPLETLNFFFKLILFLLKSKSARRPRPEQTVKQWGEFHFGKTVVNLLLAPALQGIYAGDIEELSASLILNPFFNRKKNRKKAKGQSSLVSGHLGMGHILETLQVSLESKGVRFHLGGVWIPSAFADKTVIATSAFEASPILTQVQETDPAITHNLNILQKIKSLGLVTVTCFFSEKPKKYQGFGILFPRSEKIRVLGVLMNSVIFERNRSARKDYYSETWIFGGATDQEILTVQDSEIIQEIETVRPRLFTENQTCLKSHITRWPKALPYYTVELEKGLKDLKPMKSIILHGNYLGVLGLSRLLEKSQELAAQLQNELLNSTHQEEDIL